MRLNRTFTTLLMLATAACGDGSPSPADQGEHNDAGSTGDDAGVAGSSAAPSDSAREVTCIDQSFSQLMLQEDTAHAAIAEQPGDSGSFDTRIDATAGGMQPTESFVYARFEDDGLSQIDVADEDAFESVQWHIAFRRYVIRLNSGVSGPGEVTGARTAPKTKFEELSEVPPNLEYRTEQYFSEACDYISDGSGIGAPATALASFWSYAGCLAMTGNVYVVELDDGRHVKLEVLAYYTDANQAVCDETGEVPMPSGAGNLHIRWAFLD